MMKNAKKHDKTILKQLKIIENQSVNKMSKVTYNMIKSLKFIENYSKMKKNR